MNSMHARTGLLSCTAFRSVLYGSTSSCSSSSNGGYAGLSRSRHSSGQRRGLGDHGCQLSSSYSSYSSSSSSVTIATTVTCKQCNRGSTSATNSAKHCRHLLDIACRWLRTYTVGTSSRCCDCRCGAMCPSPHSCIPRLNYHGITDSGIITGFLHRAWLSDGTACSGHGCCRTTHGTPVSHTATTRAFVQMHHRHFSPRHSSTTGRSGLNGRASRGW